jgi:hypothetical protein
MYDNLAHTGIPFRPTSKNSKNKHKSCSINHLKKWTIAHNFFVSMKNIQRSIPTPYSVWVIIPIVQKIHIVQQIIKFNTIINAKTHSKSRNILNPIGINDNREEESARI